jgi:hypothetical protein
MRLFSFNGPGGGSIEEEETVILRKITAMLD